MQMLESTFHQPSAGSSKGAAALQLKEWFKSHGIEADWQGTDLVLPPHVVDFPAPDDEAEAVTTRALKLSQEPDDDAPPELIAIGQGREEGLAQQEAIRAASALTMQRLPRVQETEAEKEARAAVRALAAAPPLPARPCKCCKCGRHLD